MEHSEKVINVVFVFCETEGEITGYKKADIRSQPWQKEAQPEGRVFKCMPAASDGAVDKECGVQLSVFSKPMLPSVSVC